MGKPLFCGSHDPLSAESDGPNFARQTYLTETHKTLAAGLIAKTRNNRYECGQVDRRFDYAQAAYNVDKYILRTERDVSVPLQNCKQQREPILIYACRKTLRVRAVAIGDQCLNLNQQRTAAFPGYRHNAAGAQ